MIIHHTLFCQLREITKSLLTNQHKMPTANVNISENFKALAKRKYFNLNWIGQVKHNRDHLRPYSGPGPAVSSVLTLFFSYFGGCHCFILNIDKLGPWEASTAEIKVKKRKCFPSAVVRNLTQMHMPTTTDTVSCNISRWDTDKTQVSHWICTNIADMGCKIRLNVMGMYGPAHCRVTLAEKSRQAICAPTCLKFRLIVVVLIFISSLFTFFFIPCYFHCEICFSVYKGYLLYQNFPK